MASWQLSLRQQVYALVGGASLACLLGLAVLFYAEWRRLRRAATPDAGVRLRRFGTAADREEVPRKEEVAVDSERVTTSTSTSTSTSTAALFDQTPLATDCRPATSVDEPQLRLAAEWRPADRRLIVGVASASDLPGRSYADRCDAVAVVRLLRRDAGRSPSSSSVLVVAESTSKATPAAADAGHPLRPVFEPRVHEFVVDDDVPLHDCEVSVSVRDDDKWTGPRTVGRTSLAGRDVADGVGGVATLDWRPLAPEPAVDRGHLLVGLSFLPTSQRILLHVDQLKLGRSAADGRCLLVRLLLLNEFGRAWKRRKTSVRNAAECVRFDESFNLDVDLERWNKTTLLVVLHRLAQTDEPSTPSGHVALGKNVTPHTGRIHWNSAFQSPRKLILQWHSLY